MNTMDPEEREAMILVETIQQNRQSIYDVQQELATMIRTVERLAVIVDVLVDEQETIKKEIANLRLYQANGWTI